MKTYVEKYIDVIIKSDLDLEHPFYDKKDPESQNEVMIPYHKINFAEVPSMDINDVIKYLMTLKDKGADRVYIADHVDHKGYYFYGTKLIEI